MSSSDKDLELVRAYIAALSDFNLEALLATIHPDVVVNAPFSLEPLLPRKVEGKEAISAAYQSVLKVMAPPHLFDLNIEPLQTPGEFLCTFSSDSKILTTNLPYKNHYIIRFTIRDGLVAGITEYFNPTVLITALGGIVALPGA
ncbi:hypothetical protein FNYG_14573 [Fusarium nygamai]|uniref:SnoaL-like domain-containing protein n=1 Tax=Gibberella nygamai TaxID=42673 RepID=A0A2K0USG1_GIBNY|nr:hypothetical protein FNYG_14573 [Fusarium nygamai]